MSDNQVKQQINMSEIESLIRAGTFSVSKYAQSTGISQSQIRAAIVTAFGDQVEFRRGRNGGVRFVTSSTEEN